VRHGKSGPDILDILRGWATTMRQNYMKQRKNSG
jgi:hypothetical protein